MSRASKQAYQIIAPTKPKYLYPWTGPIPVIAVEGKPHERGLQHGKQTKELIQKSIKGMWAFLPELLGIDKSEISHDLPVYSEKIKNCNVGFAAEMEGLAEGADVSYDDIVFLNSAINILSMRAGAKSTAALLCSSFAAWGSATVNGETVAGHNDDGVRASDQFLVLLDAKPDTGHRFCIPIVPGYLGYHTVANEAGFWASGNQLEHGPIPEETRIGVPIWTIFRYLGQYADDVESALKFLSKVDNGVAGSFTLVDKTGNAAIVHMAPDDQSVIRPRKNEDHFVLTNHALVEDIKKHLVLRDRPSSTHFRFESLNRAVKASLGKIDLEKGAELMSTHYDPTVRRDSPSGNTPCRHYEYEGKFAGTCRSAVVSLGKREMHLRVALGNPCTATWVDVKMRYPHAS